MYNAFSNALKITFDSWAKKNPNYKNLYMSLPSEAINTVVWAALDELKIYNPTTYHLWWKVNHPRFQKKIKQIHLAIIHELMFVFLSELSRGKLSKHENEQQQQQTKKRSSKKSNHNPTTTTGDETTVAVNMQPA